ncbi:MAG TPA: pyridoxal phosphate-dependent aminotransferase [Thermoanaerobaculia bacterium]|jgi:aspartate aminotransferase|nr:pyridoxal phosphate-dependent aminotransferase [Thermoanaerobaculia bacterium]
MGIDVITKPRIRLTRRVNEMQVSPTLAVMNRALELKAQGIDVVDLGPGEPDFPTPQSVCAAGKRAIDEGQTKYTAGNGTKALRDALAARYNRRYGTSIKAENVIAGTGGKQELFNVTLALVDEGDEVIIPSPYWVSFPDQVQFAGGTPVFAPTDPQNQFRPTFADVEAVATERTRGVIINSPCNPTGAVIAEKELRRIVEWCASRDLFLMFDETYEFFVYDDAKHVSAGRWFDEYPETVVCINSMSKTFAMTGWRLGYAIAHGDVITAAGKIQSHSTSNPSSISQAAALEALNGGDDEVRRMWEAYRDRRAWLMPAINGIDGMCCAHPDGAFYIFPDVSAFFGRGSVRDSQTLTSYLLDEARVAVIPGSAFGSNDHVRISYATSMERLQEGVRRIESALRNLR